MKSTAQKQLQDIGWIFELDLNIAKNPDVARFVEWDERFKYIDIYNFQFKKEENDWVKNPTFLTSREYALFYQFFKEQKLNISVKKQVKDLTIDEIDSLNGRYVLNQLSMIEGIIINGVKYNLNDCINI